MPVRIAEQVMALAVIVMIAAGGFCLLDADHATKGSLCASLAAMQAGMLLAFLLAPAGHRPPVLALAYSFRPSGPTAPPPRA